ncbi:MAG: AAC(3) family N-acetyltransferase [Kiloniellales bacterium]
MFATKVTSPDKAAVIQRMLEALEVPRDATLLVHSAFKGFARDGYDADAALDALIDYMAPGTLLMPTMSWRFVKPDKPFFDELETPSNTGILTERFRRRHASRRSLHPTHSVAGRGARVDHLLGSHYLDETPCSPLSPFGLLAGDGAHVVMMGVGMDCCTLIHHVEEMIAPELYLRPPEQCESYTCRDRHGGQVTVRLRRHLFLPRDYWQFQDRLAATGRLKAFRCDNSICLGFPASAMVEVVTERLRDRPDAIIARPGQRYRMM